MKKIMWSAVGFATAVLITSCNDRPSTSASVAKPDSEPLTAAELSMLMDFHALKIAVPEADRKFQSFRFVIIKPDGTVIEKTGGNELPNFKGVTNIMLGFRVGHGVFAGNIQLQTFDGTGTTWPIDFTDESFAYVPRSWITSGSVLLRHNKIELGTAWEKGETNHFGTNYDTLAFELIK